MNKIVSYCVPICSGIANNKTTDGLTGVNLTAVSLLQRPIAEKSDQMPVYESESLVILYQLHNAKSLVDLSPISK